MEKAKKFFKNKNTITFLIITVFTILFFGIPMIRNGVLYYMNDDLAMKAIASGVYMDEPSIHLIFSGFPFSFILVALYILLPKIDWYGTILLGSIFFFTITTIYFVIKNIKKISTKMISTLLLFFLMALLLPSICVFLTFTKVAGFIISCALILYLLPEENIFKKIIIAIGIILSYGIRAKACFMILIFFAPALIFRTWKNKEAFIKDFKFGAIIVVALLFCMFIEKGIVYHDASWKDYLNYNVERSNYYDYYASEIIKLPRDEQIKIYTEAGLNGDQIFMIDNYAFGFDSSIPEKFSEIVNVCKKHNISINSDMKVSLQQLIFNNKLGKLYLFSILLIASFWAENKYKKENLIKILPFLGLQILILLYLAHDGRIVERVYSPLYFGYITMNLFILFNFDHTKQVFDFLLDNTKILIICLAVTYIISYITRIYIDKDSTAFYKSKEWMSDYFQAHQENLYLFNRDNSEYYYFFNKYTFNNYINYGGWSAYSPIHQQKIENRGAKDLKELVFKDNVYFITNNMTDVNLYKFLDENMTIEYIDTVNEYLIYKFRR